MSTDTTDTTSGTGTTGTATHPIQACVRSVGSVLADVAGSPAWSLTASEQRETLTELARVEASLAELRLRVLAAADINEIGTDSGASSTGAWLAHETRQTRADANAQVRLARSLDSEHEPTRAALSAGRICVEQAKVIVAAVDRLSTDVPTAKQLEAEEFMVREAESHDAKDLRWLGLRLFEVIDPDEADRKEAEALEAMERRARQRAHFSMRSNGDGTVDGHFRLPELHADMLKKALQAITAPRRMKPEARLDAEGKKIPYPTLLGHGFMELIEHLPADKLGNSGGLAATIVVTISLDALRSGIGAGTLDTGTRISASEARRLACAAGIIPMVLGGDSMPLDVGRERRFHDKYQRAAINFRDRGCKAVNCDRPAAWCEAHHRKPWSEGGGTSVEDGESLCPFHHHLWHDPGYDKTRLPGGQIEFQRRQ